MRRERNVEVIARLRFTTPCLGNVRRNDYDRMTRDAEGRIIFMPTWWRAALGQAARAISRYQNYVNQIMPALPVEGKLSRVSRRYGKGPDDLKVHEGYDVGAVVKVRFAIPNRMHIRQFIELLEAVGQYVGISPYRGGGKGDYGFFKIVEVSKVGASTYSKSRRRSSDSSTLHGDSGSGAAVHAPKAGGKGTREDAV